MSKPKEVRKVSGTIVPENAPKATFRTARSGDRTVKKRVIDPDKPDFTAQFTYGFRNSVKRAREENRRVEKEA
jgi:hypothetical protein